MAAFLEMRLLPWRLRKRQMRADTLRDRVPDAVWEIDSVESFVAVGVFIVVAIIAAPVIVVLLAWGLFSVELPISVALAALLVLARFVGVIPWTVVVADEAGGKAVTRTRNLVRAVKAVRASNSDHRLKVRWRWF